jgi:hydrogenase-4 component F
MPSTADLLLLTAAPALPVATAGLHAAAGWRRTAYAGVIAAAGILAAGIGLAAATRHGPVAGYHGLLYADTLTAYMLIVIGAVALIATGSAPAYLRAETATGHATTATATRYGVLVQAFLSTMCLAVLAGNLGVTWVAIEATTITTAFLVGHRATRPAVEAAWKYVVICSVGIALAFLGVVVVHYAAQHGAGPAAAGLDWAALTAATGLDHGVMRIGVALLVLGFGTKAGLVPLHAWLPDAHSQAPAPVSALMSGVLLSVAFYAILRVKAIADTSLGVGFTRTLLLTLGLASLAVAASLLIAQRDYKRMLAYSSIEHMGLLAVGAAIGGRLAIAAVLLHILGHGLMKSVLFCSAGQILAATGSSHITAVTALLARSPLLGGSFAAGVLGLIGLPPFALFASELGIARAGFGAGLGWAVAAAMTLVLVIAAAILTHTGAMLLGPPPEPSTTTEALPRLGAGAGVPLLAGLAACAALGVTAGPLTQLITTAAAALGTR